VCDATDMQKLTLLVPFLLDGLAVHKDFTGKKNRDLKNRYHRWNCHPQSSPQNDFVLESLSHVVSFVQATRKQRNCSRWFKWGRIF
jgi:hypothetical protein